MQLGGVAVDAEGSGAEELVLAVTAGQQADRQHPRAARREQVPDGVADDEALGRLGLEPPRALDEEVGLDRIRLMTANARVLGDRADIVVFIGADKAK